MMLPKDTRWECKPYRDAANGESCVSCGARDGTVVFAHANETALGKGKGLKAHDCFGADLCCRCHDYADARARREPLGIWDDTKDDRVEFMRRAIFLTLLRRAKAGWIRKPSA